MPGVNEDVAQNSAPAPGLVGADRRRTVRAPPETAAAAGNRAAVRRSSAISRANVVRQTAPGTPSVMRKLERTKCRMRRSPYASGRTTAAPAAGASPPGDRTRRGAAAAEERPPQGRLDPLSPSEKVVPLDEDRSAVRRGRHVHADRIRAATPCDDLVAEVFQHREVAISCRPGEACRRTRVRRACCRERCSVGVDHSSLVTRRWLKVPATDCCHRCRTSVVE